MCIHQILYFVYYKEISDEKERIQTIYGLIARLPPVNHDLLERLVFHLTRLNFSASTISFVISGCNEFLGYVLLRTAMYEIV